MIKRVVIKNYKGIKELDLDLKKSRNIIVGDNGAGKSTVIEAIQLALGNLDYKTELTLYSFHNSLWEIKEKDIHSLPKIEIEIYFDDEVDQPEFRGFENISGEECSGLRYTFEFDQDYEDLLSKAISHSYIPCEYYHVTRTWFSGYQAKTKLMPFKVFVIDSSNAFFNSRPRQFMASLIDDDTDQFKPHMLSCLAGMKKTFEQDQNVSSLNDKLTNRAQNVKKNLSVSIDLTSKSSYSSILTPYVNGIPFENAGMGEQCIIKTLLSLGSKEDEKPRIIIIEEPETHLSHTGMYELINLISARQIHQLIITTHSSYVANRLDLDNVVVLNRNKNGVVSKKWLCQEIDKKTYKYFFKSTDFATLRIVLCKAAILVEGPTDEMVCNYYLRKQRKDIFEKRIELMAVGGTSFRHFVELASDLGIKLAIVRDKDKGSQETYEKLYFEGLKNPNMKVFIDPQYNTVEPSFIACNKQRLLDLSTVIREKRFENEDEKSLLDFMRENKTEWACRLIQKSNDFEVPQYIKDAINWIYGE